MRTRRSATAVVLGLIVGGCGASSSPLAPTVPTASPASATAEPSLLSILTADIQDEYRAAAIYEGVLLDFGAGTRPFSNIVQAEQQHARSVAALFTARGLAAPASLHSSANVPRFASVREACAAAARAEMDNIALYDSQLGVPLPEDVLRVLRANRAASLDNHLPAFQRCQ
jgi:hypothetical protein